jgi:Domain of unknown function (DUF3883)
MQLLIDTFPVVMECEQGRGQQVYNVREKNPGYDTVRLGLNAGEMRLIGVEGIVDGDGSVLLSASERRVAEDRRDRYWLYVVSQCNTTPRLREPINDPAPSQWTEAVEVAHYTHRPDELR